MSTSASSAPVRTSQAPARAPLSRGRAVVLCLILMVAFTACARAAWINATVNDPLLGEQQVAISGVDSAPGAVALALAGAAAALTVAIPGRVLNALSAVIATLCALTALALTGAVIIDPAVKASDGLSPTGLAGIAETAHLTFWPYVAATIAILAAATGFATLISSRSWTHSTRFDRTDADQARPTAQSHPQDAPENTPTAFAERDEDPSALWDALSRGEDPSRP